MEIGGWTFKGTTAFFCKMKKIYENKRYRIYEIPKDEENAHQYQYFIKESGCNPRLPACQIDRDGYIAFENGLDYIKELAEETVRDHFLPKVI